MFQVVAIALALAPAASFEVATEAGQAGVSGDANVAAGQPLNNARFNQPSGADYFDGFAFDGRRRLLDGDVFQRAFFVADYLNHVSLSPPNPCAHCSVLVGNPR